MSFKPIRYGDQSLRPESENLEARFHQLLHSALISCHNKGNRKSEGYIMGAFREALSEFKITVEKKQNNEKI